MDNPMYPDVDRDYVAKELHRKQWRNLIYFKHLRRPCQWHWRGRSPFGVKIDCTLCRAWVLGILL